MEKFKNGLRVLDKEDNVIAENIVKIFYDNSVLKLLSRFGKVVIVEDAMVFSVDLNEGMLKVFKHELLGIFLEFLKKYVDCYSKNVYDPLVEELWVRVKSLGEVMIRELWVRSRRG